VFASRFCRAAVPALLSFALIGCATKPIDQPLKAEHAIAIQPIELKIGIKQPEIYATFVPSTASASGAAACGAIPGIGILLAAVCGGTMGAIDASVNASRAKVAEEQVRPLKDATLDVKFDQLYSDALSKALTSIPSLTFSGWTSTKTVDPKSYDEVYRLSTSNSVMFVNVDYHLSTDFSTLEVWVNGYLAPRSPTARTAAGMTPTLPPKEQNTIIGANNAVYRTNISYHAKLPTKATNPTEYIDIWKANNAQYLRAGVNDSALQLTRILAEDIQRAPDSTRIVLRKADPSKGLAGDVIAESNNGQLIRLSNGALVFKTTLAQDSSSQDNAPKAAAATSSGFTATR
jgi:hypothetical protein